MEMVIGAAALAAAAVAAGCATTVLPPRDPSAVPESVSFAELRARAQAEGYVPVIVRFNVAGMARTDNQEAVAASIAAVVDRVLARVGSEDVRVVRRYPTLPIIAADVNVRGLDALVASPEVSEVIPDEQEQTQLNRSTVLIGAVDVWPTSNGSGQLVAVIDTGIDSNHPFVRGRIAHEACFRRDGRCPNGRREQIGVGAAQTMSASHGMHVAGITAGANARHGALRFSGVAPGAQVIPINVFSGRSAYVSDQIAALAYVEQLRRANVRVVAVNMSIGGRAYTQACDQKERERAALIGRLWALNVATVIAAGNNGYNNAVTSPGCISTAVTVSNLRRNDTLETGDNRSQLTDLLAPGTGILSSVPDDVYGGSANDDYRRKTGTSMATPHVTGAFAVLAAAVPTASSADILGALVVTGREVRDPSTGRVFRRIDLPRALERLQHP
ncbi:MAG TPA: S8 family serine peptidase [Allosphingosinicella sp.]|nr:S8 family serine peptidase [Allosphingosinicella sp.]